MNLNGQPGQLGNQICDGGSTMGNTISYGGDDEAHFERICRNWWKAFLRSEREYS